MKIVHRYILRSIMSPLLVNLLFFTFIFLMGKMLKITKLIINYQVDAGVIGLLLLYSIPHFLVFVLPMSVMMAILLAFTRMAAENEVMALKSASVSLYRMMPAALIIAGGGVLATLMMTVYGMPQGKLAIKQLTYDMLANHANVGLKARVFNDRIDQVTLYVNAIETQTMRLKDVFIEDRRDPAAVSTIVASDGQLIRVPGRRAIRLQLYNGLINQVKRKAHSASSLYFSTYDIEFDLKQAEKAARRKRKDEDEMSMAELKAYIVRAQGYPEAYRDALVEYHAKFSIPAACLALGVLAIPLGIELKSKRKSAGLGMGLIVFLMYYLTMTAGRVLAEMGAIDPNVGLWTPNVLFFTIGVFMLVRSASEKPLYWMEALRALGRAVIGSVAHLIRRRVRRAG